MFAPFLTLVIEMLTRKSFLNTFAYIAKAPFIYLLNIALVTLTLLMCYLVPKKSFALTIITLIWLGLGIANFILLNYRSTPIAPVDFINLLSMLSIIEIYFKPAQIVVMIAAIAATVLLIIMVWKSSPKTKVQFKNVLLSIAPVIIIAVILFFFPRDKKTSSIDELNLAEAYEEYGFAYCFFTGLVDHGIEKPKDYSQQTIDKYKEQIGRASSSEPNEKPNVIFLQMESFFDANQIKNITISEDPTPNFNKLKTEYPSGYLSVPTIGAGTANTEFEILTGMNIDFFGLGEYPYNSVLNKTTCESIAYNLSELGYKTHAIHNYSATFYSRHLIFANLGFKTFTSLEYMQDAETNTLGWAKDKVLTKEVLNTLSSTEETDFIYTISVQGHGRYPAEGVEEEQKIKITGLDNIADTNKYEYFVNQMYECDEFIAELIESLNNLEEKTVLVIFGDHLPSLNLQSNQLITEDRYKTEYVIWSNFGLNNEKKDLEAYELSSYVLSLLNINNGYINRLHQNITDSKQKLKALNALQYDILYGEKFIYSKSNPYNPTSIQMGINKIKINGISTENMALY
ncbi:LTA synthase family protein, partial [Eubacteriales bacterium OttesenSCG-928-G02]|nr:LTA synthase family protein [Eubacteriales bacterium OttesenSCG-928-G02]